MMLWQWLFNNVKVWTLPVAFGDTVPLKPAGIDHGVHLSDSKDVVAVGGDEVEFEYFAVCKIDVAVGATGSAEPVKTADADFSILDIQNID
jgi:hypothetical protein